MANGLGGIAPPAGFVLMDELEDYYPVNLVTAYRPGGDWSMGLDPEIEGKDEDAHGNPILGRSTMEDYLEGNADYVTVAMDKASSWQGQYLESPQWPGVPFKVMDNGGFGNDVAGNGWVDIAFRDPRYARSMTEQGVPFRPISEEQAKEMRSSRVKPPEGFVTEEEYAALSQGDQAQPEPTPEATPKKSYFPSREEELAAGGKGPNYPQEEEDRIPLESELAVPAIEEKMREHAPPEGFVPEESFLEKGNIDVSKRPPVSVGDGQVATVHSMGIEEDGVYTVIPQVVGGKLVSADEAVAHYHKSGEHLGKFADQASADSYAQALHKSEEERIGPVAKEGYLPIKKAVAATKHADSTSVADTANDIWNSVKRGWKRGEIALEVQKGSPSFEYIADKTKEIEALPASDNFEIALSDKVGSKESLDAFTRNPIGVLGELLGESIGTMARTGIGYLGKIPERTAQGIAGGATIGTMAGGPAGGVAGGVLGGSVGLSTGLAETGSLGSYAAEYSGSILDSMQEAGVDTKDPEALKKAWNDPAKMAEWRAKAEKKGVPIALLDGLSIAIGGKMFAEPAKKLGGKALQWGTELLAQMGLGMGGEAGGQLWSEGEITSIRSILAEGIAEVPGGIAEVGVGRIQQAFTKKGMSNAQAKDLAVRLVAAARAAKAAQARQSTTAPAAAPAPAPAPAAPAAAPAVPEFGPVTGGVRQSLAKNLSPESQAEAGPLADAATAYISNYDDSLAPAAAHEAAMKAVPPEFKPAFRMLPGNAMEAEPEQFGEWLARAYEGGKPPAATPGKSVAQMIKEAKVEVETKKSAQALDEMAEEEEGAEEPFTDAELDELIAKSEPEKRQQIVGQVAKARGQRPNLPQRRKLMRAIIQSYGRNGWDKLTTDEQKSINDQSNAIADFVAQGMEDLGLPTVIKNDPDGRGIAGVAHDPQGNLEFIVNPARMYTEEQKAQRAGIPIGYFMRFVNGEELIHAADLIALRDQWRINPYGQDFWDFITKHHKALFDDIQAAIEAQTDPKTKQALYDSLVATYRSYFVKWTEHPIEMTGPELLAFQRRHLEHPDWRVQGKANAWVFEFVRQVKQLRDQGAISEEVQEKFYPRIKQWVGEMLRRIRKMLPRAFTGEYGPMLQQRLQRLQDILDGKDVLGAEMFRPGWQPYLWRPEQDFLEMFETGKYPKTIINIGMTINPEAQGELGLAGQAAFPPSELTEKQIRDVLESNGVKILGADIYTATYEHEGKTVHENTYVAELERAMDEQLASHVAAALKQEAIVQRAGANGEIYGPKATKWRPFNSDYFVSKTAFRISVERLEQLAKDNEQWKDWYDNIDAAFNEILKGYEEYTPLVKELLAALSAVSGVKGNVTETVKVLQQFINDGTIPNMLEAKRGNVLRALRGEKMSGPKVGPFSAAMFGLIDSTAIDRHVARVLFGTDRPTPQQHKIGHERIAQVAARLGWTNRQLQAALFAADIREQGKPVERYEDSIRAKQEEIRGILGRDITGRGREAAQRIAERVGERRGAPEGTRQDVVAAPAREAGPIGGPPPVAPSGPPRTTGPAAPAGRPDFGPSINPPRQDIERFFLGAQQIFAKYPEFKFVADAIGRHIDLRRLFPARFGNPYRQWMKEARNVKPAIKAAQDYWAAEDQGRAADAAKIAASANPDGQELIKTTIKNLNDMWDLAEREGLMIEDPITHRFKPFKKGAHLWPRIIKPEVLEIMRNTKGKDKAYKDLRDQLINSGDISATNPDADMVALRDRVMGMLQSNDVLSNVDMLRTSNLPTALFDYSFNGLRRFAINFGEAMARRMSLGQKVGTKGKDVFDRAYEMTKDEHTRGYIRIIQANAYNQREHSPLGRAASIANEMATPLQLANPRSVERNLLTGTIFNMQHFGIGRTLSAMIKAFHEIPEAMERGAISDDILSIMSDGEQIMAHKQRLTSKLAEIGFKYSGWNAVEHFVRGTSYAAAKAWLRDSIRENLKNPSSRRSLLARGRLQRLGLNPDAVLLENGSGEWTDRFLRKAVAEIQGGYQYDQVPGFIDSPAGRFLFKYRKFGTQALTHFDREVVRPAVRAISLGKFAKETVQVKDPVTGQVSTHRVPGELMPAVAFIALMVAAGAGEEWLAENLFGIPKKNATFAEILSRMHRNKAQAFGQLLSKLAGYVVSAGGLGLIGDAIQSGMDFAAGKQPKDLSELVPSLAPLQATFDAGMNLYESKGEQLPRQVDNFLKSTVSAYRTGGQMLAQGADVFGQKTSYLQAIGRRQDLSWLRGIVRRYNQELAVQARGGPPAGRRSITPETPFREQLKEYLMIGDTKAADKMIKDHFRGWSAERQEEEMKNLQASVRASQPIKAGPGGGEIQREAFLRWTKTALSKADQARLMEIDKVYRESAQALDLMDPKPPKEKDIEKAMRRIKVLAEADEDGE
jgi:hypothetical protein